MSGKQFIVILFSLVLVFSALATVNASENPSQANSAPIVVAQNSAGTGFVPVVRMLGFRQDDQIEWVVTISNTGTSQGEDVLLTSVVPAEMQVNTVMIRSGSASVNGQNVQVFIPLLAPGETVQFSIFTSVPDSTMSNSICATAANFTGQDCAQALPIQALPSTGELPSLRRQVRGFSLIAILVSAGLLGVGLFGWRLLQSE